MVFSFVKRAILKIFRKNSPPKMKKAWNYRNFPATSDFVKLCNKNFFAGQKNKEPVLNHWFFYHWQKMSIKFFLNLLLTKLFHYVKIQNRKSTPTEHKTFPNVLCSIIKTDIPVSDWLSENAIKAYVQIRFQ